MEPVCWWCRQDASSASDLGQEGDVVLVLRGESLVLLGECWGFGMTRSEVGWWKRVAGCRGLATLGRGRVDGAPHGPQAALSALPAAMRRLFCGSNRRMDGHGWLGRGGLPLYAADDVGEEGEEGCDAGWQIQFNLGRHKKERATREREEVSGGSSLTYAAREQRGRIAVEPELSEASPARERGRLERARGLCKRLLKGSAQQAGTLSTLWATHTSRQPSEHARHTSYAA